MEKTKIIELVNIRITSLCKECDPNCARQVADSALPHCYTSRPKINQLLEAVVLEAVADNPSITDADGDSIDVFFKETKAK